MARVLSTDEVFRDPDAVALLALVGQIRARCVTLEGLIEEAIEVQFEPSPVPRPREDTTQRASGGHSDRTSAVVFDGRRWAVRECVTRSLSDLRATLASLEQAIERTESSLNRWAGH